MRLLMACIILLTCCGAHAAAPKDLVKAQLLADVAAVKAGTTFNVGVLLKLKAGWHVYWKHPGDSGAATRVELKLPDGWTAGELRFPIPTRFDQSGVIGYGYEDEVMLVTAITPPGHVADVSQIELTASVKWLACADVCIPGKAELNISLPMKESPAPANAEIFARWQERMPRAGDAKKATLTSQVTRWMVAAVLDEPFTQVEWFPNPPVQVGVREGVVKSMRSESTFTFELVPPQNELKQMSFLIAYTTGDGRRRGIEFALSPSR